MSHTQPTDLRSRLAAQIAAIDDRWPGGRRRAGGLALALLLEGGLLLLLLTLGRSPEMIAEMSEALTTFSVAPDSPPAPEPESASEAPAPSAEPAAATAEAPALPSALPAPQPSTPAPVPLPRTLPIPVPPAPAASPSIRAVVRENAGPIGPAGSGARPGDSQRIAGSGPNGEPLYAARWYREPGDAELAGYLSTATSAGWALINCRTVPNYRVEDCLLVDEYPANAGLGRAVLAAAWQFQVRPPRVGGQSMVGAWVRIRITYEIDGPRPPAAQQN